MTFSHKSKLFCLGYDPFEELKGHLLILLKTKSSLKGPDFFYFRQSRHGVDLIEPFKVKLSLIIKQAIVGFFQRIKLIMLVVVDELLNFISRYLNHLWFRLTDQRKVEIVMEHFLHQLLNALWGNFCRRLRLLLRFFNNRGKLFEQVYFDRFC